MAAMEEVDLQVIDFEENGDGKQDGRRPAGPEQANCLESCWPIHGWQGVCMSTKWGSLSGKNRFAAPLHAQ